MKEKIKCLKSLLKNYVKLNELNPSNRIIFPDFAIFFGCRKDLFVVEAARRILKLKFSFKFLVFFVYSISCPHLDRIFKECLNTSHIFTPIKIISFSIPEGKLK